jgi:hypothetical protein
MFTLLYRHRGGSWCVLKRYKTLSGAMSGQRAHAKRFGFGGMFQDQYSIVER